jgi:hypothetical protein
MGSITSSRLAVPLSIAALALVPVAGNAAAMPVKDYSMNGASGDYTPPTVHKDYSKNGASGDFTPAVSTTPAVIHVTHNANSFAWGAAAIGSASTLVLVVLFGLTTRRVRRRRIPAPSPARPAAA